MKRIRYTLESQENDKGRESMAEPKPKQELSLPVRLRKLFFSTLYLSTFTFGGGYVIVSLLKKKFVDELHWIDEDEMLDLVAIAQSAPGAIAVNGAIVVGFKIAGIPGILVSVLGAVLPPFVILTVVSYFYSAFKNNFAVQAMLYGMKAGVSAVIIDVVFDMASGIVKGRDALLIIIMIASFIANYFLKVNVVWIILVTAGIGALITIVRSRREGGAK
jgi:chromate transporter